MLTPFTRTVLFLTMLCGVGIGILAPFSDGLYSAILLFSFPFLVAVMALAIGRDLNKQPVAKTMILREQVAVRLEMHLPMVRSQQVN